MINDLPGELAFNARGAEHEEQCPANNCGNWLWFGENQVSVTCPGCQSRLGVHIESKFVDGKWIDTVKLYQL